MRALITGITGFAGSHLAEYLLAQGIEVSGTARHRSKLDNIEEIISNISLIPDVEIRDAHAVAAVVKKAEPDYIFHLAAQSFVPASWMAPADTFETNVMGTVNLLEAVRRSELHPVIHVVGSSEEYGCPPMVEDKKHTTFGINHKPDMVFRVPITEDFPLLPMSPYGISKVAEDLLGYQYHKSYGMKIVRTRAFNHSVSASSPVIIKDNSSNLVQIEYIGDIRRPIPDFLNTDGFDGYLEWSLDAYTRSKNRGIEVLSENGFSRAPFISAHQFNGELLRIITPNSIYEVTENHSVITPDEATNAGDLRIGDEISLTSFENITNESCWVHPDIAWLYGLFAAEGSVSIYKGCNKSDGKVRIANKDESLLEKASQILLKYFGATSNVYEDESCNNLNVQKSSIPYISAVFRDMFYTRSRDKKVPTIILNAQGEAKSAFLLGYNEGDGLRGGHSAYQFKNFKTKSKLLAAGLCYLISCTTKQRWCLNVESRNNRSYISINLNAPDKCTREGDHLKVPDGIIKNIERVPYFGWVYDLTTKSGKFNAGIGTGLVHNTGPRRGESFATSNFAKQIVEIEKGRREPVLKAGNLEAKRDFSDVRDIVRAYWLSVVRGKYGEVYNICSGRARTIQSVLDTLRMQSTAQFEVVQDRERMRPSDIPILEGDCSRFRKQTGWKPEINFTQTMGDLLDYWREKI